MKAQDRKAESGKNAEIRRLSESLRIHRRDGAGLRHLSGAICLRRVFLAAAVVAACAVGVFFGIYKYGFHSLKTQAVRGTDSGYAAGGRTLEDTVVYQEKTYRRNRDINTILCMGLDTEKDMTAAGGAMGTGAQSDANFLVTVDRKQKKLQIIAIPRDTMTELETFYLTGEPLSLLQDHLALQYAMGDGGTESCALMQRAVSRLFYNLPVDAYVVFSLNAIENLNGMVGGVTVELTQDFEEWKAGETVTLNNEQAYHFIRWRDCGEDYSAVYRLQRQKQYLTAFVKKAVAATRQDIRTPFRMYEGIADSVQMNLTKTQLLSLVLAGLRCDFSEESLRVIPGEQVMGEYYEEFYVDESALYEMILDVFYIEEQSGDNPEQEQSGDSQERY